jgi:hypothetical protein
MSSRPVTLAEIATRAESLEDFGRHFRDWLHELRRHSSRSQLAAVVEAEPPRLAGRFAQGAVADAWLAAYAEHLAARIGRPLPAWAHKRHRVSPEPWFATETTSSKLRLLALRDSPPAFKRRNLFTPAVDLPLALRAGRPVKSAEEKRRNNAERQRRFRARLQAELKQLRAG